MKIVQKKVQEGFNHEKTSYFCSNCGVLFNWTSESSWYGSYKDYENGRTDRIKYACSSECQKSLTKTNE